MNKSVGSKLFKLKKWLTLPEAAKHLTVVCNEEVTEADILEFTLEGHLRLSVYFPNETYGIFGKVENYFQDDLANSDPYWKETELDELAENLELIRLSKGKSASPPRKKIRNFGQYIGSDNYIRFPNDSISEVIGIWDLAMLGGERLDVEQDLQSLKGWPSLIRGEEEGVFIKNDNDIICQLMESYDNNPFIQGSNAELEELMQKIMFNNVCEKEAETLLNQHKENRRKYIERVNSEPFKNNYFEAFCLPKGYVLVVRPESLISFEQYLSDNNATEIEAKKPHGNGERFAKTREEVMGAALSVLAKWPDQCQSSSRKFVAAKIAALIDEKALLFWPLTGNPPLGREKIERNISEWLKKTDR